MANSTLCGKAAFVAHYGDLATALRNFDAVRYTTIVCAALGVLGSLCILPREIRLFWRLRFTLTRFLLLINQVFTLPILCANIRIFMLNRDTVSCKLACHRGFREQPLTARFTLPSLSHRQRNDACSWWFGFRSWSNNVVLLLITIVVLFRLVALFDQKALIIIASTIAIAAQAAFSTAFMAIHADEWGKLAAMAPIPGPSFKGCFPVLSQEDSRAVWFSAMTVQSLAMITAVFLTIRTWWMGDSPSFLALAQRNGIFHFMAITSSTVFAKAFFSLAPKSLVLAATPVTMVVYSFFGSLLLLNLHEQQSSQLDPQAELSTYLSRSEINGAGLNAKSGKDLELGLPNAAGLSKKVHRTPESEATLALSPPVTVTSRQHQASPVIEKQSPMPTPPSAMVPSEQVSINQLRADNIIVEEGQPPKAVLPTLGTMTSNSSLSRHYSSQDSPNTDGIETLQEQQIEWTALEEALAEEYDEDGKRRRPRRTHERKWKSDEPVIVTPPTFPFPVSQEPRPPGVNFSSPGETLMSPILASTFNSDTVIPSSSLTKPPSQTKKVLARSRLSGLLHRRQPLQASKHTSTHVPTSVPEGVVDVSPGPVSLPTPDSPSQPLHRSSSTRRSSQSYTARLRRLPAMSGGSISPGLARARTQGESDGATVSSASTGWAFDNNNTRDAPDFGN